MSRKEFGYRGKYIVGIFPEDPGIGHIRGRRGIRRTLCSRKEVRDMEPHAAAEYIARLHAAKQYEIRRAQIDERLAIDKKKAQNRAATFSLASSEWLGVVKASNSAKTYILYRSTINLYLKTIGDHKLKYFDRSYNVRFLNTLAEQKSKRPPFSIISNATQNMHTRHLQNFISWAYDWEYLTKPIRIKKAKLVKKDMKTFTIEEVNALQAHLKSKYYEKNNPRLTRLNKNLYRAFMLARHTLVRSGHLWALKLNNIDLEHKLIYFTENAALNWKPKGMKWPNKPINRTLMTFLKEDLKGRNELEQYYLDKGDGRPWYLNHSNISKPLRAACNELGLSKQIKPFHWGIRATFITYLLNEGVPPQEVQQLADHSDISTTMGYYNTRASSQKNAVDMLG
jgi:integrase